MSRCNPGDLACVGFCNRNSEFDFLSFKVHVVAVKSTRVKPAKGIFIGYTKMSVPRRMWGRMPMPRIYVSVAWNDYSLYYQVDNYYSGDYYHFSWGPSLGFYFKGVWFSKNYISTNEMLKIETQLQQTWPLSWFWIHTLQVISQS